MGIRKSSNRAQSGGLRVGVEIGWVLGTIPQLAHPCRVSRTVPATVASAINHAGAAAGLVLVVTTFTFSRMRVISR